ncbi:MAG: hypothetical protein IKU68_02190 [Oscillospiraceae bacterium]|nr:hypothetical protein [Oscillospiraceae bacterium]
MKKILALLLCFAMLLSLAACGAEDPNAGIYNAVSCTALGMELDCEGDWLELKKGGKAELCLMGDEYFCSWSLEGELFTLKNHGDTFSGTLKNGIITVDYGDMIYVYIMDSVVTEENKTIGHVHVWQEADCETAKTCIDCSETEGEPLGHTSTEANYQDASVCTVCGAVTGEVLQPDMEKYGITEFMEPGTVYPYTTELGEGDVLTVGEVEVLSYEVFPSSEEYPAKEGYEWRVATFRMSFFGYMAYRYGVDTEYNIEDYYNITLLDDTVVYHEEEACDTYTVNYHGQLMEVMQYDSYTWDRWMWKNDQNWVDGKIVFAYCVPEGYDGAVVGFRNSEIEWTDDMHLYDVYTPENFLLFRLD